jgi:ribosomal protein S18 acetylase RimI-like enzyme
MSDIRRLAPEEALLFQALRIEAMGAEPEAFVSTLEEESAKPLTWFAERLEHDPIFGAFLDGELVGMAGFTRMRPARERHRGQVWSMYVRAPARGRGLAGGLLRAVIEHARTEVEVLELIVVSTNTPAVALYEKHGFKRWGLQPYALRLGQGRYTVDGYYYLPLNA